VSEAVGDAVNDASAAADRAAAILAEMKLEGEVYLEDNLISSVCVSAGKVESLEMKEELGMGIRVFDAGRVGFAHTSDLAPEALRGAVAVARAFAAHTDPDAANRLPRPEAKDVPEPDTGDPAVERVETYRKTAIARAMEEAARAVDPRITKVPQARYTDVVGRVEVRNTEGVSKSAAFARVYGSIEVLAESGGEAQSGHASDFALRFQGLDPFKIGREAARRAIAKLGGERASTRRADVVLDPEVAGSLLEAFSPALSADNVLKGKSAFSGWLGRRVASPCVQLVDDGRFPGGNRTFPFDAEGVPTRRTVLIEAGVLKGYLNNWYTAAKMGSASTGNAFRSSYMAPPRIARSTLYLVPSAASREEVLGRAREGAVYVSEVMGLHTMDPITGEFSLGATGHAVTRGGLSDPIAGMGLAGSIFSVLSGVVIVGSDLRLLPSGSAGSSTLVRDLSISGS